jgi:hypothetical protein
MDSEKLVDAARRLPPSIPGTLTAGTPHSTVTTCTAATATAATATGVATYGAGYYSFAVGAAFEISFSYDSTSTVADPADDACFPAGVYEFWLEACNSHFKITANTTTKCKHWKSGKAAR